MERKALMRAMKNSISEVLETMFFLPVDFSDTVNSLEIRLETEIFALILFMVLDLSIPRDTKNLAASPFFRDKSDTNTCSSSTLLEPIFFARL